MVSKLIFGADLPTEALFIELFLAGLIVVLAGTRFTRLANALAERMNLGGGWIGLTLLAGVTSLPELVTGATATWVGNIDLALGAIFGSCCFNITLIVLLNAFRREGSVLRSVSSSHALTSSFGLALIGIALMGLVLLGKFSAAPQTAQGIEWSWVALIALTYMGCMRLIHRHERLRAAVGKEGKTRREPVGAGLPLQIGLMAVVLVAASWWLAMVGDVLSDHKIELIGRPLGATFIGAVFLALSTSLPEIVTSVAAVRLGDLDLALGNIFGSNMFNIFVIPLLKVVSWLHGDAQLIPPRGGNGTQNLITGLLAILLTAIAVGGLAYKSQRRIWGRFGFDSILILITYLGGMALLLMEVPHTGG